MVYLFSGGGMVSGRNAPLRVVQVVRRREPCFVSEHWGQTSKLSLLKTAIT